MMNLKGWFDPWALLQAFKMSAINRGAEYVMGRAEKFEARDGRLSKVGDSDQANDPLSIFGLPFQ